MQFIYNAIDFRPNLRKMDVVALHCFLKRGKEKCDVSDQRQ